MFDTFTITIIFLVAGALVASFMKGRIRDKCLVSFSGDIATTDLTTGRKIWGRLVVENTGLEFVYPSLHEHKDGYKEASYILYKFEYPMIQALIRYHDELDEKCKKDREQELRKVYHPTFLRRIRRKILNVFKTMRDTVMDLLNIVISQEKKNTPVGSLLKSQDKYVSQMKNEMVGFVGTAYEPILEKHIGSKVILEFHKGDKIWAFEGILKDYTSEFIELLDVDYKLNEDSSSRKADVVVSRKCGFVRHLGEARNKK